MPAWHGLVPADGTRTQTETDACVPASCDVLSGQRKPVQRDIEGDE